MEENRKRPGSKDAEEFAGKRSRTPAAAEDNENNDVEDMMAWLFGEDETVSELKELLETEMISPVKVRFIDDPYSSTLIFQTSSYVTINGNDESCGSSFSDSGSSVMVSIDTGAVGIGRRWSGVQALLGWIPAAEGGTWGLGDMMERGRAEDDEESCLVKGIDGSDWCGYDDDMLARFLGEDVFESGA